MQLADALERYVAEHPYGVAASTVRCCYGPAVRDLELYLGRVPLVADLDRQTVNAWIDDMRSRLAMPSVRNRRAAVMALWRWLWDEDLSENRPEKIRRVRSAPAPVEAWTRDQIKLLVAYVRTSMRDRRMHSTGLSSRAYWETLILAAYDTGLRLGDLLGLKVQDVTDTGSVGLVHVRESKTGKSNTRRLSEGTMRVLRPFVASADRELIWPLWCRRDGFYEAFRGIVADAGLKGTFRFLRRSGATHVEADSPGQGYLHTNHSSPDVTLRHYIDRSQLTAHIVAPTPLEG